MVNHLLYFPLKNAIISLMAFKLADITDFLGFTDIKSKEPTPPSKPVFNPEAEGERRILFEWETITRPASKIISLGRINRTYIIIGGVVALLLVAMQEFFLIAVIASIIFLANILSATPPEKVRHIITNHGISYAGHLYSWADLRRFYFINMGGMRTLCIDTVERLPGRLYFVLNVGDEGKVKELVSKYLSFLEEEPKTVFDKVYEAAVDKIAVEK